MKKHKFDRSDVFILLGVIGILVGVWLIYIPVSVILAGLALIGWGLFIEG
ncbi:hypothetical protein M0R72_13070 [Candidatus Pacearchaeota archaeon]|jgi:uncharacterized membrane protein HdeD (DUF308 family)|nr:hypothetical protein [Candidatus Pacearchaeota archaeon]